MATGVVASDQKRFDFGVQAYKDGVDEIDQRGAFPKEMARADRAIHYQSFALQPLVTLAAFAERQGVPLYSYASPTGRTIAYLCLPPRGVAQRQAPVARLNQAGAFSLPARHSRLCERLARRAHAETGCGAEPRAHGERWSLRGVRKLVCARLCAPCERHNRNNRLALPLSILILSSSHRGTLLIHSTAGGLGTNGQSTANRMRSMPSSITQHRSAGLEKFPLVVM